MEGLGYFGLFISSLISATIVPMSSEGVLSYLYFKDYNPYMLVIFASIGNTLGAVTGYYLGYFGQFAALQKYFGISSEKLEKQSQFKYLNLVAFLCWLPIIGDFLAVYLGYIKYSFALSLRYIFLGKLLRYIAIIGLTELGMDLFLH